MKIAVFSRSTPVHHPAGGMERHLEQLVQGLERKHTVTVFTTARPAPGSSATAGADVKAETDQTDPASDRAESRVAGNGLATGAEIESLRYVYVEGTVPGTYRGDFWGRSRAAFEETQSSLGAFDAVVSQSAGAWGILRHQTDATPPVLAIMHGTARGEMETAFRSQPFHPKSYAKILLGARNYFRNDRVLLPRCDQVVAVSEAVAQRLRREIPGLRRDVEVILNGVDTEAIRPHAESSLRVLFAGRVIPEKGVFVLLEGFARVADRFADAELVFVGGGDLRRLDEAVDRSGLADRVRIVGPVSHERMPSHLASGSVFVLPSLRDEGLPLSILEAMAAGLPVIASRRGGIGEVIRDGEEGALLSDVNAESVANALTEFLESSELRRRLGAAGRSAVEARFGLDSMVDAYEAAIESMVARRNL